MVLLLAIRAWDTNIPGPSYVFETTYVQGTGDYVFFERGGSVGPGEDELDVGQADFYVLVSSREPTRTDAQGRDVTGLYGLHDESDRVDITARMSFKEPPPASTDGSYQWEGKR